MKFIWRLFGAFALMALSVSAHAATYTTTGGGACLAGAPADCAQAIAGIHVTIAPGSSGKVKLTFSNTLGSLTEVHFDVDKSPLVDGGIGTITNGPGIVNFHTSFATLLGEPSILFHDTDFGAAAASVNEGVGAGESLALTLLLDVGWTPDNYGACVVTATECLIGVRVIFPNGNSASVALFFGATVPEPWSFVLLLTGLGGLSQVRRRTVA